MIPGKKICFCPYCVETTWFSLKMWHPVDFSETYYDLLLVFSYIKWTKFELNSLTRTKQAKKQTNSNRLSSWLFCFAFFRISHFFYLQKSGITCIPVYSLFSPYLFFVGIPCSFHDFKITTGMEYENLEIVLCDAYYIEETDVMLALNALLYVN